MKRKNTQVDGIRTGEKLQTLMKQAELSIADVAKELDVTTNAVRNYIKGFNLPDTEKMYNICKILDVDIKDIIVEKTNEDMEWRNMEEIRK